MTTIELLTKAARLYNVAGIEPHGTPPTLDIMGRDSQPWSEACFFCVLGAIWVTSEPGSRTTDAEDELQRAARTLGIYWVTDITDVATGREVFATAIRNYWEEAA